jgi:uncharacterized membrane protein
LCLWPFRQRDDSLKKAAQKAVLAFRLGKVACDLTDNLWEAYGAVKTLLSLNIGHKA